MNQKDRSCNQDLAFSCKGIKPPVAADGRVLLRASNQQVSHVRVGAKASSKNRWGGSEIPLQGPPLILCAVVCVSHPHPHPQILGVRLVPDRSLMLEKTAILKPTCTTRLQVSGSQGTTYPSNPGTLKKATLNPYEHALFGGISFNRK